MQPQPAIFDEHESRRVYDETTETWWFSVVDIVQVFTQQSDYQSARNYWKVLKNRLGKEGSESVTKCNRLKLPAADGKNYLADVATAETLLRLVQSVPSPKAEREIAQSDEGAEDAKPARPHERGRADFYCAGGVIHAPDCREHGGHGHERE